MQWERAPSSPLSDGARGAINKGRRGKSRRAGWRVSERERTCCRTPMGSRSHVTGLHIATVQLTYMRPTQRHGNPRQTWTPAAAPYTRVNFSTAAPPVKAPLCRKTRIHSRMAEIKTAHNNVFASRVIHCFIGRRRGKEKKKEDTVVRWILGSR